jgi:hypothetical protein
MWEPLIPNLTEQQARDLNYFLTTVFVGKKKNDYTSKLQVAAQARLQSFQDARRKRVDDIIEKHGGFRHGRHGYPYVGNEVVTAAAKAIFGDIAVTGYAQMLNPDKPSWPDAHTENDEEVSLTCDQKTVVVEFVNGRRVEFTASEWGAISLLK